MMTIQQNPETFKLPGSESPLKKSTSVTAIIHGSEHHPNNVYYVDSLERFKRDYASVEKQEREQKIQKKDGARNKRRMQSMERELSLKNLEDGNYQKMKDKQSHSLQLHNLGAKMTIHSKGTPIDPLTLRYEETEKGRQMQIKDQEKSINNLVRAHKIQTWGTSGYNIITGQRSLAIEEMVPQEKFGQFHSKLSHYYQKFRIKPEEM